MQHLEEILNRVREQKSKLKELQKSVRDHLESDAEYLKLRDEFKALSEKKKSTVSSLLESIPELSSEVEALRNSIKEDSQLASDIAVTKYASGESVHFTDKSKNVEFIPKFTVSYQMKLL
ncbi:MAG: hypothetical protein WC346_09280 [Methanogenium sp.]|jgi:uncharacterized coiled-coil DUF342 family protein